MKTRWAGMAVVAIGAVLALAAPAAADHEHYTDGTETYPPTCYPDPNGGPDWCLGEDGWGPPVLVRVDVERCVVVVDPPYWIWFTGHVVVDGVHLHGTEPYEHDLPGEIDFDLAPFIDDDGKVDDVWFTWNIGSGESAHTGPIDCTDDEPAPTTSTTQPTTTTTTQPTTTTTVTPTTPETTAPTPFVDIGTPQRAQLPVTGSSITLAVIGGIMVAAGAALILRREVR